MSVVSMTHLEHQRRPRRGGTPHGDVLAGDEVRRHHAEDEVFHQAQAARRQPPSRQQGDARPEARRGGQVEQADQAAAREEERREQAAEGREEHRRRPQPALPQGAEGLGRPGGVRRGQRRPGALVAGVAGARPGDRPRPLVDHGLRGVGSAHRSRPAPPAGGGRTGPRGNALECNRADGSSRSRRSAGPGAPRSLRPPQRDGRDGHLGGAVRRHAEVVRRRSGGRRTGRRGARKVAVFQAFVPPRRTAPGGGRLVGALERGRRVVGVVVEAEGPRGAVEVRRPRRSRRSRASA